MTNRYFLILAAILCIPVWGHAQIGAKAQQGKLFGTWQNSQFGYQMTLILSPDGTGEFDGEAIRHTAQGNRLSIILGDTRTDYTYILQGDALTLSGGDLDGKVTFARNGTSKGDGAASGTTASATFSNTSDELVGLWSGNGEMFEFRADGKCVYLGNTYDYHVSQGHVILSSPQGSSTFGYSVKGKVLTLTVNGSQYVYTKALGSASGGVPATSQGSASGGGKVPMELVGQWCYMNMTTNSQTSRCITLNADGTYTYSSESSRSVTTNEFYGGTSSQGGDRGTWWVQGDRIYYNSQSSGQGSYRLEKRNHPKNVNDPMIVLDGEPYVTATIRQPWR